MNELYLYMTPKNVTAQLRLQSGLVIMGYGPIGAHGHPNAYHFQVPPGTPKQKGVVTATAQQEGYQPFEQPGVLVPNEAGEALFIIEELVLGGSPPPPVPPAGASAEDIVMGIANTGFYDFTSGEGCGLFVEECQRQLFLYHSPQWGLIRADPAEPDQYNGHLWDKVMVKGELEGATIWDLVFNSAAPDAHAQCMDVGAGDPSLWYSPTAPPPVG